LVEQVTKKSRLAQEIFQQRYNLPGGLEKLH